MILSLLLVTCLVGLMSAFPNGAPEIACGEMIPGHLPTTTSGTNPFMLNISSTTYKAGDVLTGYLYGADNQDFKGFLIRVGSQNSVPSEEQGVGEFVNIDKSIQKHVCGTSAVTHINNNEKKMVKFSWQAPASASGDLYIRATVVQKFFPSQYWVGAFSQRISPAS